MDDFDHDGAGVWGDLPASGRLCEEAHPKAMETDGGPGYRAFLSLDRGSLTTVPLCSSPLSARSRHAAVEWYSFWSVSTVEITTPGRLRRARPMVMPSARTKKAGQALSGEEELGQLIHMWFDAAAAVMAAGMVMPG